MPSDIDIMISFRCFRRTAQVVVCVSRFHVKIDKVETPMEDSKQARLEAASNPRRATLDDAVQLSYLFATALWTIRYSTTWSAPEPGDEQPSDCFSGSY